MKKLKIIYDATKFCKWNCPICCMGASPDEKCRADELSLSQKLDLAEQIKDLKNHDYDVSVDVSGGEIFNSESLIEEHKKLLLKLNEAVGKENLGVSCSGANMSEELAGFLAGTVSDVEMTMDVVPYRSYVLRPVGYSVAAAKAVVRLKAAGCKVGLQTVVSTYNLRYEDALAVFAWAAANGVDNWSLLRFFPSGRGESFPEAAMTDEQCLEYVRMVQKMIAAFPVDHKPEVDFHYTMPGHKKYSDVCRCVRHSVGILPNGDVTACFWAVDNSTGVVDPKFYLGNVKSSSLSEILDSPNAHFWSDCEHCCELFSGSDDDTRKGGSPDVSFTESADRSA